MTSTNVGTTPGKKRKEMHAPCGQLNLPLFSTPIWVKPCAKDDETDCRSPVSESCRSKACCRSPRHSGKVWSPVPHEREPLGPSVPRAAGQPTGGDTSSNLRTGECRELNSLAGLHLLASSLGIVRPCAGLTYTATAFHSCPRAFKFCGCG